ncbi:MAG TPA: PRC and DUF2382 domain-containing protein [Armatimonadota bacterium]|jgi:uncharacterized protein (TIGR02271 family)
MSIPAPRQLPGHRVEDRFGKDLGTIPNFWVDEDTGRLEYVGVKSGWLHRGVHPVPADHVELRGDAVRLAYLEEEIRDAPTVGGEDPLTLAEERRVTEHFRQGGRHPGSRDVASELSDAQATHPEEGPIASPPAGPLNPPLDPLIHRETTGRARQDASEETAPAVPGATAEGIRVDRSRGEVVVPIAEERLEVGKRTVDAGQVRVRKVVRTEHVRQPVELTRETISVERVPVDRGATGGEVFQERDVVIPVRREEPVVNKTAQVVEEVHVRRQPANEQRTVDEVIRREDVLVDKGTADDSTVEVTRTPRP